VQHCFAEMGQRDTKGAVSIGVIGLTGDGLLIGSNGLFIVQAA